jgi:hypothetical protein
VEVGRIPEGIFALSVGSVKGSRVFRMLCLQLAVLPFQIKAPIPGCDQGRFHRDDVLGLASEDVKGTLEGSSPSHKEGVWITSGTGGVESKSRPNPESMATAHNSSSSGSNTLQSDMTCLGVLLSMVHGVEFIFDKELLLR